MSEGMEDRIRVLEAQVAELAVHLARSMNHLHELDERAVPAETADFLTTTDQRLEWLSTRIDEVETWVYRDSQPPPDHPTTWTYGDPEPPAGTILAANRQPPVTAIGGHMYATDTGYCREDELNRTADHCQVLRWGWTK